MESSPNQEMEQKVSFLSLSLLNLKVLDFADTSQGGAVSWDGCAAIQTWAVQSPSAVRGAPYASMLFRNNLL
jgi:hypothetical protein